VNHFIFTALNIKRNGKSPPAAWLDHRMRVFSKLTLPSLQKQVCKDFQWLVLYDCDTPEPHLTTLKDWEALGYLTLMPDNQWQRSTVWKYTAGFKGPYITTRLDSDDFVHPKFTALIQNHSQLETVMNLDDGAVFHAADKTIRRIRHPNNMFISKASADPEQHIFRHKHSIMCQRFKTLHIRTPMPMWCIMVHDMNLANGRRISKKYGRGPEIHVSHPTLAFKTPKEKNK